MRGSLPALIYSGGDKITWKVLTEYSWNPTTTQWGSFLCTVASSTPIRVVTREERYIHELSLILEHSMPICSSTTPGLTGTPHRACCPLGRSYMGRTCDSPADKRCRCRWIGREMTARATVRVTELSRLAEDGSALRQPVAQKN